MKFRKDFIGLDGFYWWFGVVENRQDPLELGRCQVRIFGTHTEDLSLIPSEDLPWAHPMHSLNNQTFSTPKEGDYIFGFFIDGKLAQSPVMVGIIPGIPAEQTDPNSGFSDIRTPNDIQTAPKKPESLQFNFDGSGVEITEILEEESLAALRNPSLNNINIPTNSNLTRNQNIESTIIKTRKDNLASWTGTNEIEFREPPPAYGAQYPYNKVLETESGNVMEFDDTPGDERIHIAHRSGSFSEWYPSGSKVEKIVKNNYKIVLSDDNIYIQGRVNITVDSNANIKVLGDVNLEAYNDFNADIAGNMNFNVGESFNVKATNIVLESSDSTSIVSGSSLEVSTETDINMTSVSDTNIRAKGTASITGETNVSVRALVGIFAVDAAAGLYWGAGNSTTTVASSPLSTELGDSLMRGVPNSADPYFEQTPADKKAFTNDDVLLNDEELKQQIFNGELSEDEYNEGINAVEGDSDQDAPPNNLQENKDCGGIENVTELPNSLKLSNRYTLGMLSGQAPLGDSLREQRGLTKGQIACNLKLLAINCLDTIKEEYPSMIVTNAYRYPTGAAAGKSQHEIGQAADMQFPGTPNSEYYNIVLWIRDNTPHDQLLLEYKTTGTKLPWIHISFNKDGNRAAGGFKNATFMNHKSVKPYFVNLA